MAKNKLEEGIVGRVIVQWFRDNTNRDNDPVDALYLDQPDKDEVNYRLYFEDGTIADYHIRFETKLPFVIESCEEYNRVI